MENIVQSKDSENNFDLHRLSPAIFHRIFGIEMSHFTVRIHSIIGEIHVFTSVFVKIMLK